MNSNKIELPELILASASPRRADILRSVGWRFETLVTDVDETLRSGEAPSAYVERLARSKAEAAAQVALKSRSESRLVLGADTTVVLDGEVLGKPRDREDARRILTKLQGKWHEVLTGVALVAVNDVERSAVAHERTRVRFAEMSASEIEWYVGTNEPLDKAGAYGIQGQGALFIRELQGDYWNVVGLPIRLAYELAHRM